jgi:hypothetical protein
LSARWNETKGQETKMLTTDEFVSELALIIRGEHPAWEGDRIANAELFCHRVARDFDETRSIADDIERNIHALSDSHGMSPSGMRWTVNRIRECL